MRIYNMHSFLKILCCIHVVLLSAFTPIQADELSDNFHFNGFYTLDYTVTKNDLNLISNSEQHVRYQAEHASFKNSLIGGQLSYQFTDDFKAVVQGKFYDDTDADLRSFSDSIAQLDWAYLSYDFGDDVTVRAGRFQIPFMQGTELRNISFSRLWARPLIPSTGAGGLQDYTGGELLKHMSVGDSNWDFQLALGKANHGLDEIDNKNIKLLSVRYQQDAFWLRAAILASQYSMFTKDDKLITDSGDGVMFNLESEYVIGSYLFNAGYSISRTDITPDDTNYYLSIAYQSNDITPYIYHSHFNQFFEPYRLQSEIGLPPRLPGSPPPTPGDTPRPIQASGNVDIYNWAVGAKYLINERYAIKVQLEHIKEEDNASSPADNGEGNALSIVFEGIF